MLYRLLFLFCVIVCVKSFCVIYICLKQTFCACQLWSWKCIVSALALVWFQLIILSYSQIYQLINPHDWFDNFLDLYYHSTIGNHFKGHRHKPCGFQDGPHSKTSVWNSIIIMFDMILYWEVCQWNKPNQTQEKETKTKTMVSQQIINYRKQCWQTLTQ